MKQKENFLIYDLNNDAYAHLHSGKRLKWVKNVYSRLMKSFFEDALKAEMEGHLSVRERARGNRRNGYQAIKKVRSIHGSFPIRSPRDRLGTFTPKILRKRETILTDDLDNLILSLYGKGMSLHDISSHLKTIYDNDISTTTISSIIDTIIPAVQQWQNRPLESSYCMVWLDAMHFKIRQDGQLVDKCMYNILGVNMDGRKELLGMYVSGTESAHFWLSVMTNLQARGVKDILIASIDNLKGFKEAIETAFPATDVQLCIVHQVRSSIKYIARKDKKQFIQDMQYIYQAASKEQGEWHLGQLVEKWQEQYRHATDPWKSNWEGLSNFFRYTLPIRKMIYTTNTIESFHRSIRKVTKSKGVWESDLSLTKLLFLASQEIQSKWSKPLPAWHKVRPQLTILFGERAAALS